MTPIFRLVVRRRLFGLAVVASFLTLSSTSVAQKIGDVMGKESITNRPLGLINTPPPAAAIQAEQPEPEIDLDADEPPSGTSALEKRQKQKTQTGKSDIEAPEEDISWSGQLLKTVIALLVVVGLIYLLFKLGLARFIGMAAIKPGKSMKVVERVQLDARHALVIIQLDGQRRLLLGTGEQGVQVLAQLDRDDAMVTPVAPEPRVDFQRALEDASSHAQATPSAPKSESGSSHG